MGLIGRRQWVAAPAAEECKAGELDGARVARVAVETFAQVGDGAPPGGRPISWPNTTIPDGCMAEISSVFGRWHGSIIGSRITPRRRRNAARKIWGDVASRTEAGESGRPAASYEAQQAFARRASQVRRVAPGPDEGSVAEPESAVRPRACDDETKSIPARGLGPDARVQPEDRAGAGREPAQATVEGPDSASSVRA